MEEAMKLLETEAGKISEVLNGVKDLNALPDGIIKNAQDYQILVSTYVQVVASKQQLKQQDAMLKAQEENLKRMQKEAQEAKVGD